MDTRLKLFSLSDINGRGEAKLSLITQADDRFTVTMTIPDLVFWSSRIAAAITKAAEEKEREDARLNSRPA